MRSADQALATMESLLGPTEHRTSGQQLHPIWQLEHCPFVYDVLWCLLNLTCGYFFWLPYATILYTALLSNLFYALTLGTSPWIFPCWSMYLGRQQDAAKSKCADTATCWWNCDWTVKRRQKKWCWLLRPMNKAGCIEKQKPNSTHNPKFAV